MKSTDTLRSQVSLGVCSLQVKRAMKFHFCPSRGKDDGPIVLILSFSKCSDSLSSLQSCQDD